MSHRAAKADLKWYSSFGIPMGIQVCASHARIRLYILVWNWVTLLFGFMILSNPSHFLSPGFLICRISATFTLLKFLILEAESVLQEKQWDWPVSATPLSLCRMPGLVFVEIYLNCSILTFCMLLLFFFPWHRFTKSTNSGWKIFPCFRTETWAYLKYCVTIAR